MRYRTLIALVGASTVVWLFSSQARRATADDQLRQPTAEQLKFFETSVRPVLKRRCIQCHGDEKQRGDLRLDSREAALKGGYSGGAIVPGKPQESLLVEAIRYESYEMPPDEQLPDKEIAAIAAWVKMGAPWPPDQTLAMRNEPTTITDEDRAHWSFQPVADPPLPEVNNLKWCRSAIDRFILARLEQEGLAPAEEASPLELLRRVYFDMIGLPPTPEEIDAYLNDERPDRYERLVDRLLEDPRYGDKWARHWLDVVRYAESDGWRQDAFRPEAYKYRDYVIRSFNEDKPMDRFIMEQIAGDEIDPGNPDAITATAFLRHGIYEYNQRDVETQWDNILNEITDVTGDALLGLGMACARCHDHKFDPIPQKDYFRLRAFFEPILWREDQPQADLAQRTAYEKQLVEWKQNTAAIRRQLAAIERPVLLQAAGGQGFDKFAPHLQAMMLKPAEDRSPREHQIAILSLRQLTLDRSKLPEKIPEEQKVRWKELQAELGRFDHLKPEPLPTRKFAVSDVGPEAPPTYLPGRESQGPIEPGFLSVLSNEKPEIKPPPEALKTTGRRTALAHWIADANNPLSTRVIVNRIWQRHFGTGLVATPDDFGSLGETPTHPKLLDWLTRRFLEDGWSLKALHRRIVLSAVYRQTSRCATPDVARKVDPGNRLLWRMNTRRLTAEAIRDVMLYVSGELDQRLGGPSVAASSPRRSIYVRTIRNTPNAMLAAFDMANGFGSTAKRDTTTTPLQALLMINGPFPLARAAALARRVESSAPAEEDLIEAMFMLAYSRPPSEEEQQAAVAFLKEQAELVELAPEARHGEALVETMPQTGGKAALFQPDGEQPYFAAARHAGLPEADFTVEAVVLLETLYKDASVRTIAAQWNSDSNSPGWALGVTSEKSAYRPRNLIVQLVGNTAEGKRRYEVIASDIHLKLNTPYYVAVRVDIDNTSPAGVQFYVDDLSVANEPPQRAATAHDVVAAYRGSSALTIGGRDQSNGHRWDGLIDEIRISRSVLPEEQLLLGATPVEAEAVVAHWRFENTPGELLDSSGNGMTLRAPQSDGTPFMDPSIAHLIDFGHVLLNSNEFLYVD